MSQQHGPSRTLDLFEEKTLIRSLLNKPDMYLEELKQEHMQVTGIEVSFSTVCRTLKHLGFSRKRFRYIAVQRSDERRLEFQEDIVYFNADMLVWTDECGSDRRNEVRKYGYNLRGMTPVSYNFINRGKRFSAIPVLTTRGIEDVFVTDKTVNGDIFLQFVEQCLVPVLSNARSVVIMDNASIHHVENVVERIQQTGAIIQFLPPYSPDLNPAEEVFTKIKKFLVNNDVAFSTTMTPSFMITMAFNTITTADCNAYIRHAGYL